MFFVASKFFWMVASPVTLLLIVASTTLLISIMRASRAWGLVSLASILLLAALALTPIGLLMIAPLEDRFPEPPADIPPPDGIIVLGGALRRATPTRTRASLLRWSIPDRQNAFCSSPRPFTCPARWESSRRRDST